jgi:hypothetical protein
MSSRVVTIELDVDDAQAVKAWQRGKQAIAEFDKQGGKAKQTFGDMFAASTKSVIASAAGFAGVGSVIGGLVTAAGLLRNEYDNLLQRQEESRRLLLGTAPLQAELISNASRAADLGDTPKERAANVLKLADQFAAGAGVPTKDFLPVASQAVSSRGNKSVKDALTIASLATLTAGGNQQTSSARTSLGLTLAQGDGIGLAAGLGFGIAAGEVLPIADQPSVASALGRTIPAGLVTGATAPETTGLFGAFATKVGDTEGKRSATFTLQALGFLDKLAPQFERVGDQIEYIVKNPDKFGDALSMEKLPGESAQKPLLKALLTEDDAQGQQLRRDFAANRDKLPRLADSGGVVRDLLEAYSASDAINLNAMEQGLAGLVESAQAANVTGATTATLREKYLQVLQSNGVGYVDQLIARAGFATSVDVFGEDPKAYVQEHLRSRANALTASTSFSAAGTGAPGVATPRFVSDEDRATAGRFRAAADSIDEQVLSRFDRIASALENAGLNLTVNGRKAPSTIGTPAGPRKHSRLNSHSNAPPATGGRR